MRIVGDGGGLIWKRFRNDPYQRYRGGRGVPQNFGRVRCSIGPPQPCFITFLRKNFRKFRDCVVLWDQIFLEKSAKNSIHFQRFFQKINVLRFKMVSNGKILKNFDEITHKTPYRLFLELSKISKNFENLTPKTL